MIKALRGMGVVLWIAGACLMDSEKMIVPVVMVIVGIFGISASVILQRKKVVCEER